MEVGLSVLEGETQMTSCHDSQHSMAYMRLGTLHPLFQVSPIRILKAHCNETSCFLTEIEQRLPFLKIFDDRCYFVHLNRKLKTRLEVRHQEGINKRAGSCYVWSLPVAVCGS